jgi:hypothetical protein
MRWKVIALGFATAFVGSMVLAGTASSDGVGSETIWLFADANEDAEIFLPASGGPADDETPPVAGDRNISRDDLFLLGGTEDAPQPTGAPVGRNDIECTFVELSESDFSARLLCHGVIEQFGLGTIAWQASLLFSQATEGQPFNVAITGGTGIYANAGGEIVVRTPAPSGGEDELDNTVYEIRLLRLVD